MSDLEVRRRWSGYVYQIRLALGHQRSVIGVPSCNAETFGCSLGAGGREVTNCRHLNTFKFFEGREMLTRDCPASNQYAIQLFHEKYSRPLKLEFTPHP